MAIVSRQARIWTALLACTLLGSVIVPSAYAADTVAKGYEETIGQNHNGLGVSFGVGGLNGLAYRRNFGNLALQLDVLPLIASSGNYLAVFGGLTFIDYLVMWNKASRSTFFSSTTALRLVGSTGVWLSRDQSSVAKVPAANANTPQAQAINNASAPIDYFAHVGIGVGLEMGAIARPGFSAALDVQMTVMWDQIGFYGAYPLPSASLMYNW